MRNLPCLVFLLWDSRDRESVRAESWTKARENPEAGKEKAPEDCMLRCDPRATTSSVGKGGNPFVEPRERRSREKMFVDRVLG